MEWVLAYPRLAHVFDDPAGVTALVRSIADVVEPASTLAAVADEPDNRVLEVAVEAGVDAIVTVDAGLLALVEFQGIPIMSATKFLEWWGVKELPAAE